jgi:glycosyltransferase involved in cell wall biosynthesis
MTGYERDPGLMNDLQDVIEGDGPAVDAAVRRIGGRGREHRPGVTAVIPSIPPRSVRSPGPDGQPPALDRAVRSLLSQTRPVDAVALSFDHRHEGAAVTRNRGLAMVRTEWTVFLDDDDVLLPDHVGALMEHAEATGADVVYPWFDVVNGFDPFPQYEGRPFSADALRDVQNFIPVTVLVRTGLARGVGGFEPRNESAAPGASPCEEWGLWLKLLAIGARFEHLNRRTWEWHWHPGNTSGRGDRW